MMLTVSILAFFLTIKQVIWTHLFFTRKFRIAVRQDQKYMVLNSKFNDSSNYFLENFQFSLIPLKILKPHPGLADRDELTYIQVVEFSTKKFPKASTIFN